MFIVVGDELAGLEVDSFEYVIDKAVHDAHASLADTCFWMHLFQYSVDVD